jgi:imidazoleglycerol-phosphate dehydratase
MSVLNNRSATIDRQTKETQISLTLKLDKPGENSIHTTLPFLSHMLNTFAVHGRFGLCIQATGDIEVDPHHLVEDVGIVLGMAIRQALGDFSGIHRAGHMLYPMDGTLARVALDLCNRPNLFWEVPVSGFPVGNLDPRLFKEFFKGMVDASRMTLHVDVLKLDNDHHAIEAVFKGFTKALRMAVQPLDLSQTGNVLSTKGTLSAD